MTTLQSLQTKVGIDLSDVTPGIAQANAVIGQGLAQAAAQAQAGVTGLEQGMIGLTQEEIKAEAATIRTAQAYARMQAAQGDRAAGAATLRDALDNAAVVDTRLGYSVQTQIANLEKGATAATDYGAAFQQGLLGIVGPAAVVSAALGAVVGVADSFKEAFTFDAQLGANTKAIEIQLQGVRDSGIAFQQAQHYADTYKLTQQETTEAMIASIPVIRNSTASLEDILGVFDRLQIRQPGKTFQDAARALGELQAGQVVSIEHMFNVPANDANRMKKEIEAGGDAVQVLSQYLTDSGIGMDALSAKTTGAMGALKDYAKAQEDLKIAQGEFAKGPGIAILDTASRTLSGTTRVLTADWIDARKSVQDAIQGGIDGMTQWNPIADAFARVIGNATGATQAQAAATADVFTSQQELTELTGRTAGAFQAATKAQSDYTDVSKLTEEQLKSLSKAVDDTGQRASDAYAKLTQAQTDYQTKGQEAAAAHTAKLADMARSFHGDLDKIDKTANDARTKANEDRVERIAKITEDGNRHLTELESAYTDDIEKRRASANERYQQIDATLNQKIQDDRASSAQRIAEIVASAADAQIASAQASADRQIAVQAQIAEATTASAAKLATFEQTTLDTRATAQAAYSQKVVDLAQRSADLVVAAQESAARRSEDTQRSLSRQMEDAATRASDQAEDRQISEQERAQSHADKLAAIQAAATGSSSTGRTTTLTGGRFTTESNAAASGGGASIADQIASENARYQAQLAATQRSEALTDSRAARDAAKSATRAADDRALREQDAAAQLAQQQAALSAQQAALDRDYAAQVAKAQAAADKQRAVLAQAAADKLIAIQAAAAQADTAAAKSDAVADARSAAQIVKERAAQAGRELDANTAAERARAQLIVQTNRDLADRQAGYEAARAKAIDATNGQINDQNTAYAKQTVTIAQRRTEDSAAAAKAYVDLQNTTNEAYKKQQDAAATAYRTQVTNLKTALGEQETAYIKAQEALGQITHTAALARETIIADSYGRQAAAQRAAFDAAFGNLTTPSPTSQYATYGSPTGGAFALPAPAAGGGISIGNVTVNGVQNAQQFLDELRGIVTQGVRNNGGDANKYWGGTPQ